MCFFKPTATILEGIAQEELLLLLFVIQMVKSQEIKPADLCFSWQISNRLVPHVPAGEIMKSIRRILGCGLPVARVRLLCPKCGFKNTIDCPCFIFTDGKLDVFQHNKLLTSITVWTTFGELAILYNSTRTASVRGKDFYTQLNFNVLLHLMHQAEAVLQTSWADDGQTDGCRERLCDLVTH